MNAKRISERREIPDRRHNYTTVNKEQRLRTRRVVYDRRNLYLRSMRNL